MSDADDRDTASSDETPSNSMAEQLGDLELDPDADPAPGEGDEAESDERPEEPIEGEGSETHDGGEPMRGSERFREAVDDLSRKEMERRKYGSNKERGTLADAIDGERVDVEEAEADQRHADDFAEGERRTESVSAREQLEAAVDDLSEEDMKQRKFDDAAEAEDGDAADRGGRSSEPERTSTPSDESRTSLEREREQFEAAMHDVDRMEGSNRRRPEAPDPSEVLGEGEASESETSASADFVTPTLDKTGAGLNQVGPLGAEQRAMRDRFEAWERTEPVPELNLRGNTVEEALDKLERFVETCRREGDRFGRVIPGRGLRSEGEPVLKPAVLTWFEEEGADHLRGYFPERSMSGDYGSLIVEFDA